VLVAGPAAAEDPADAVATGDTVVGELVQAFADPEHADPEHADPEHADPATGSDPGHAGSDPGHAGDTLLSWVDPPDAAAVRVPTEDVTGIAVGATVEVTVGAEVHDEAAAEQGLEPARDVVEAQVLAPAQVAAAIPHTNAVTVAMVRPGGAAVDGTTLAEVAAAVDGPVRGFWEEQSNGAVTVAVTGRRNWFTTRARCSDPVALFEEAARIVNWAGGPGQHLLLYVPAGTPGCAYGLGTIGSGVGDGGVAYVQDTTTSVIAHELGHNFGLGHASAKQCDGSPDTGTCRTVEYADLYDVMGISWGEVGSLNAPHAARLGLLPASARVRVPSSGPGGTWTLTPMGARSGVRVLELAAGTTRYWVEYRAGVGRDGWLSVPARAGGLQPGVLVHADGPGPRSSTSLLLDGTPSARAQWDADGRTVLPRGARMTVGGLTLTVTGATSSGATLTVRPAAPGPGETAIAARHRAHGGAGGSLRAPVGGVFCGLRDGGCGQHFQGGSIYWSPTTGARILTGGIRDRWAAQGWENGPLGYPTTDVTALARAGGRFAHFQGGSVYWSPATGVRVVSGAVRDRWAASGWENGPLGYPTTDVTALARAGGRFAHFQGGSVYWSPTTGAHPVGGAIRDRWAQLGWENGRLGYPVEAARTLRNGDVAQRFQGGTVTWVASTRRVRVS
jgi:hypothetical protein